MSKVSVGSIGSSGGGGSVVLPDSLTIKVPKVTTKLDYDTVTGDLLYVGEATPGSQDSASVWSIKKLTYDAGGNLTDVVYPVGNSGNIHKWSDRATYTYR